MNFFLSLLIIQCCSMFVIFAFSVKISSAIDAGVLIVDVGPNSPAFVAGLRVCIASYIASHSCM